MDVLSEREWQIARAMVRGDSNKQIAYKLGISSRTVEVHCLHIALKLGTSNRVKTVVKLLPLLAAKERESNGEGVREGS